MTLSQMNFNNQIDIIGKIKPKYGWRDPVADDLLNMWQEGRILVKTGPSTAKKADYKNYVTNVI